jgi:hypothetical protein
MDSKIIWSNKKYRIVLYAQFGHNLQKWSHTQNKWYSMKFSRDAREIKNWRQLT